MAFLDSTGELTDEAREAFMAAMIEEETGSEDEGVSDSNNDDVISYDVITYDFIKDGEGDGEPVGDNGDGKPATDIGGDITDNNNGEQVQYSK